MNQPQTADISPLQDFDDPSYVPSVAYEMTFGALERSGDLSRIEELVDGKIFDDFVGPLRDGDQVEVGVEGISVLRHSVAC